MLSTKSSQYRHQTKVPIYPHTGAVGDIGRLLSYSYIVPLVECWPAEVVLNTAHESFHIFGQLLIPACIEAAEPDCYQWVINHVCA